MRTDAAAFLDSSGTGRKPGLRAFMTLAGLGELGVLSAWLTVPLPSREDLGPAAGIFTATQLRALVLAQPMLLVLLATAVGLRTAPMIGCTSYIVEYAKGRGWLMEQTRHRLWVAALWGMSVALVTVCILLLWPVESLPTSSGSLRVLSLDLLAGVGYGGVAEEIIARWGLLSLIGVLGSRVLQTRLRNPQPVIMWLAIAISSLLFGLGHLPLASALGVSTASLARVAVLNTGAGVLFGWLYWKEGLESAMSAHAAGHGVFYLAGVLYLFTTSGLS